MHCNSSSLRRTSTTKIYPIILALGRFIHRDGRLKFFICNNFKRIKSKYINNNLETVHVNQKFILEELPWLSGFYENLLMRQNRESLFNVLQNFDNFSRNWNYSSPLTCVSASHNENFIMLLVRM